MKVTISVRGIDETLAKLERVKRVLKDVQPEMKEAGNWLLTLFSSEVFDTNGQILGENWAPLSDRYLAVKAKIYPGRGTLERTGNMRNSWRLDLGNAKARIYIPDSQIPYAKYHQNGGGKLPRRTLAKVTPAIADKVISIFRDSLEERVRKAA